MYTKNSTRAREMPRIFTSFSRAILLKYFVNDGPYSIILLLRLYLVGAKFRSGDEELEDVHWNCK